MVRNTPVRKIETVISPIPTNLILSLSILLILLIKPNAQLLPLGVITGDILASVFSRIRGEFYLANNANDENRGLIIGNLSQILRYLEKKIRWVVTHFDAKKVMNKCCLQRDFYDFIDELIIVEHLDYIDLDLYILHT